MRLLRALTNKYLVTLVVFAAWMFFFDQNDFFTRSEKLKELQHVKDNISYLKAEIGGMERDYNAIVSDPRRLEQVAREQFRMKRDNEDVYIVEHK